jgi:hypothetical protein
VKKHIVFDRAVDEQTVKSELAPAAEGVDCTPLPGFSSVLSRASAYRRRGEPVLVLLGREAGSEEHAYAERQLRAYPFEAPFAILNAGTDPDWRERLRDFLNAPGAPGETNAR